MFIVPFVGRCLPQISGAHRKLSTAAQNFRNILQKQINDIHAAGTYKNERIITSPQKTVINIAGSSKSVVNFCANNYLGMSVSVDYLLGFKMLKIRQNFIHFNMFRITKMWWSSVKKFSKNMDPD